MSNEPISMSDSTAIAVIGISCRFPGADNTEQFWENLKKGVESVEILNENDLIESGVEPDVYKHPNYVRSAPVLNNIEMFDAGFFGFSPGEAKILDPQRRLFLMCGWEAFEDAGYIPYTVDVPVAVFGSAGVPQYFNTRLCGNKEIYQTAGEQQILISNDKDHLPTHLSYKLNLKGPSVNVNTACSSSLVAVHLARMSLLLGECDMAIAGGSSIMVPNRSGYMYVEDSILSRDGHCRAFDENGSGTLWGSGCGVVLLKRLSDAIRDDDNIRAVIRGSAINNDGNDKVGYTAPSVNGQSEVVIQALAAADLEPKDISYIEAHGTGTRLGDPIEVAALINVFEEFGQSDAKCLLGSVKPNIGHLGAAAGIASFIKGVLALENGQIPPSINFETPNSRIDFVNSPFTVNSKLTDWQQETRRLGVSSLAVGGTNCHIIMEGAPLRRQRDHASIIKDKQVAIFLSARTNAALANQASNLANFLLNKENLAVEDVAYTLQFGRNSFEKRAVIFAENLGDVIVKLDKLAAGEDDQYCNQGNVDAFCYPEHIANANLNAIKEWINRGNVDWGIEGAVIGNRIALPTYPFEMQRYWVEYERPQADLSQEFKLNHKSGLPGEWFYEQSWKRKTLRPLAQDELVSGAQWLVFASNNNLSSRIVQSLTDRGESVVVVVQGDKFEKTGEGRYKLNPENFADYDLLVRNLMESFEMPSRVVHMWAVESRGREPSMATMTSFINTQFKCYYSVLNLIQAMNRGKFNRDLTVKVLTSDMHEITGVEKIRPEKSSIIGLVKVLQQEFQNITCQAIDLYVPARNSADETDLLTQVENEILYDDAEIICAFRNGRRWVQRYERIEIAAGVSETNPIKKGGVYLVYDGLVGIGLEVSKTLLTEYQATVLVLGDVSMPPESGWDDWCATHDHKEDISVKIGGFKEIEKLGGIFLGPMPRDNDVKLLADLVQKAEMKYGKFNGVIHCSGGSANGHVRAVNKASHDLTERDFVTVPYALISLDSVFRNHDLDFRLVMSSLGSILGGILFVSYGASNCLAASFAEYSNAHRDYRWNVQCWDSWDIEWKIEDYKNTTLHDNITDRLRAIALTVEEGLDCFHRSLAYNSRYHVTISSTDLQARINKWVNKKTMEGFKADTSRQSARHPRPAISTDYVPPVNELEKTLASAFEKLLDIDSVGRNDNFFELGGHSLLATQLITELRSTLNADIAISDILESPTVERLGSILHAESKNIATAESV